MVETAAAAVVRILSRGGSAAGSVLGCVWQLRVASVRWARAVQSCGVGGGTEDHVCMTDVKPRAGTCWGVDSGKAVKG